MKSKVLIISLIIIINVLWGPSNETSFSGDLQITKEFYESCIVKEIVKCDAKSALLSSSRSLNLRNYAKMKAQEARFLEAEKEALVKQMLEMKLEPKQYKVELFFNSRFREKNRYKK